MNYQNWSKKDVIHELEKTQSENKRLNGQIKEFEFVNTRYEELLSKQSQRFAQLNRYSLDLANQSDETIAFFIVREFKSFFLIKEAWISIYNEESKELVLEATTLSENDNSKIVRHFGKSLIGNKTTINEETCKSMISLGIGKPSSLHEISFGEIPVVISSAVEKLFSIGWFQGIALTDRGKLYAGLLIAGYKGQQNLNNDELRSFSEITSNILRRKKAENEAKFKNEQLQKSIVEKDKLFSIIAHDLRSPFNSFLGLTQLLSEEFNSLPQSEIQRLVNSMKVSASNLYALLENLLEWSAMQRGQMDFKPETILLHQRVKSCVEMIIGPATSEDITISCNIPKKYEIIADKHQFDTVIRNLVSNAIKFSPSGSVINISAKSNKKGIIEVSVKDSGIGMNAELLSKLFRIDQGTSRKGIHGEPSTGLGLLLCKEFIEKNGGTIWVESKEGAGSTFSFTTNAATQPIELKKI